MNSFYKEFEKDLENRGFTYGGGRLSPDKKYFYLNIPKNANSLLDQVFSYNEWTCSNLDRIDINSVTPVIVMRDPIERWISGISQYLSGFIMTSNNNWPLMWSDRPDWPGDEFFVEYNDTIEALLFERIIFDDHTMPQYYFFDDIQDHSKIKFFYLDSNLRNNIIQTFNFSDADLYSNKTEDDVTKTTITRLMKQRIDSNPILREKLESKYATDYKIINNYVNVAR